MNGFIALVNIALAGFFMHGMLQPSLLSRVTGIAAIPSIFGLGSAAVYLFFLWASWLGDVNLAVSQMWVITLGIGWFLRRKRTYHPELSVWPGDRKELLIFIVISLFIAMNLAMTIYRPILDWDTRILWALKAKMLALEPTLTSDAFRDPYRLHIHPRYPLLVPFLASWSARLQGDFLEPQYQMLISIFALLTIWQTYLLLTRLVKQASAIMLTAVMACSGAWLSAQYNSGVEIPLTFFLVLAVNYLLAWEVERQTADILLAGIFLFSAAMVKNEGVLLAACSCLALFAVLSQRNDFQTALRSTAFMGGVFLLLFSGWAIHLVNIPAVSDEQYLSRLTPAILTSGLQRLDIIAETILHKMLDLRQWHLLWMIPPASFICLCRRRATVDCRLLLLAIITASYCAGLLLIYIISPWRDIAMHINVTFDRVTLPLLPLFIVMIALVVPGKPAETIKEGE